MATLKAFHTITGQIHLVTGLHIGAGSEAIEIGGVDNPVIKDPHSGLPYIPGSSLKGKMRTLLEYTMGQVDSDKPHSCNKADCAICMTFGTPGDQASTGAVTVTRAVFRDALMNEKAKKILDEREVLATDVKYENSILRLSGKATNPRQAERAIPNLRFDLEISIKEFEGDGDTVIKTIMDGLKLVQKDALGGYSSRGYGKVKFVNLKLDDEEISFDG